MFKRSLQAIALAALVIVCIGCRGGKQKPRAKPSPNVPTVDAQILDVSVSPDSSLAGLVLQTGATSRASEYKVAIFDLKRGKLLATSGPNPDQPGTYWSPDSRQLAWVVSSLNGVAPEATVHLIAADGHARQVHIGERVRELTWRGDRPDRFVCVPDADDIRHLIECDTTRQTQRKLLLRHTPDPGLSIVHGRPVYWYHEGRYPITVTLRVVDVDSGRKILSVPLYDTSTWDLSSLHVSPDGQYFHLRAYYSASTRDVVARVQDAGIVFKQPLRAIMWQDDIECSISEMKWLQSPMGRNLMEDGDHLAIADGGPPFVLDLDTGSRNNLVWDYAAFSKRFSSYSVLRLETVAPNHPNQYIVVSGRGLELCSDNDEPPRTLLLSHTKVEQR